MGLSISTAGEKPAKQRRKKSPQNGQGVTRAVWGPVAAIEVDRLDPHPQNRQRTDAEVAVLAESLRISGQLEPVKIWRENHNGRPTVIGGWGRVLAARAGGQPTIEARPLLGVIRGGSGGVEPPTRADLLGLLAEDNSQRHDLTVFERAELGRALREAGYTWDEAARRVGFQTRGSLANAERLLSLPESLRDRIGKPADEGGITQEAGRRIASVAHVPEVLAAIEADLVTEAEDWREHPEDSLFFCVGQSLRPVDQAAANFLCRQLPTDLPVVEIALPADEDGEVQTARFTPDVAAWDKAATTTLRPRGAIVSHAEADEDDAAPPEKSEEDERLAAAKRKEQIAQRRSRWEYRWRHRYVLGQLRSHAQGYRQALARVTCWAIVETHKNGGACLKKCIDQVKGHGAVRDPYPSVCDRLACMPAGDAVWLALAETLAVASFADWETSIPDFPHVPADLVRQCCADFGFDPAREWDALYGDEDGVQLLRDLWNAHDSDALRSLFKRPDPGLDKATKTELVERLISNRLGLPAWLKPDSPKKGRGK